MSAPQPWPIELCLLLYYSKPPHLANSSLAKSIFSDCLNKGQTLNFSDFLSYLANSANLAYLYFSLTLVMLT